MALGHPPFRDKAMFLKQLELLAGDVRRVCYPLFLHSVVPERFEEATCQAMSPTRSAKRMPKILIKIIIVPIKIATKSSKNHQNMGISLIS